LWTRCAKRSTPRVRTRARNYEADKLIDAWSPATAQRFRQHSRATLKNTPAKANLF